MYWWHSILDRTKPFLILCCYFMAACGLQNDPNECLPFLFVLLIFLWLCNRKQERNTIFILYLCWMIVAFCLSLSVLDERFHERSGTTEADFCVVVKVGLFCQCYRSLISHVIIIAFMFRLFSQGLHKHDVHGLLLSFLTRYKSETLDIDQYWR